ncbi:biotin/lipoyl-binding protein [Sphingomonas koreensis]|jgi:HlyD family secretion protein|uniref:Biotin/lipoyl-binding protein n=1 Tax=Sphingomonas koreensis TaxID=93064 RepID=A0A2M8WHY5_9SPHN|nr:HlyD family efflux transporter periplasmic adaptor subunit [Sphingomonas koreensis]PJI90533.1 HlyD family secretion protein [Sphingomonas koreensis]RSU59038.1 biotin/lipoyl-binding protein [Sphingomonas koreensis]RSU67591.1 biotin/lipoyl-binding protein [Sphingomonas koreensis]RSY86885.1 biotin/lipoyl-binding protein [Sphingomonas koreensis]
MSNRSIVPSFGLMFLSAALLSGCGDPAELPAATATQRDFVAIAKGKIDVEGGVIRLAAQREGLIQAVFVEEGDRVKKGQVLAQIDTRQAELGVAQARADLGEAQARHGIAAARLQAAEREAKRLADLAATKAVPVQDADKARDEARVQRGELATAAAAIAVAREKLKRELFEIEARRIRAPLDGRIVRRSAKPGDGASTFNVTELFLLAPESDRIVRAELDEQFVSNVRPGQRARILLDYDGKQAFAGQVLRLGEVFGARKLANDDPNERQDMRVIEMVVSVRDSQALRIGQRVQVQVLK